MLIHITPTLLMPAGADPSFFELIDVCIPELSVALIGNVDVVAKTSYPNKRWLVACKKARKSASGILIESETFIDTYTSIVRWAFNADKVLTHITEYHVIDSDFDVVTDEMTLWTATQDLPSRWPSCHADAVPLHTRPRMDVWRDDPETLNKTGHYQDTFSDDLVQARKEVFLVPTIERSRFTDKTYHVFRIPSLDAVIKA